jgi:hypothetical protein
LHLTAQKHGRPPPPNTRPGSKGREDGAGGLPTRCRFRRRPARWMNGCVGEERGGEKRAGAWVGGVCCSFFLSFSLSLPATTHDTHQVHEHFGRFLAVGWLRHVQLDPVRLGGGQFGALQGVDTVGSGERGEGGWWSAGESEREGRARDAGRGERLIGRLCGFSHLVKLDDLGHCARHALDVKLRRLGDMVDLGEMAGSACERKKSVALSSSSSRFFLFLVFWLGHGRSVQSRTRLRRLRQP